MRQFLSLLLYGESQFFEHSELPRQVELASAAGRQGGASLVEDRALHLSIPALGRLLEVMHFVL